MNSDKDYALSVGPSDLERMTMLGEIYMPYCAEFLIGNGLKPGLNVADIGCGPGNTSLWLSKQVGETGKVLAIDNSDAQLTILEKKIMDNAISNITTLSHDIYQIEQIKERFDLIFCRFLFVHLVEPLKIIEKLYTLLNPGGYLILAELDNSTWFSYPLHSALQHDTKLLCEVGNIKGSDFSIGPKLYGYLRKNKFASIRVKIEQPVLVNKYRNYLTIKSSAWDTTYVDLNLSSKFESENRIKQLQELGNNQDYLLAGAKMYLVAGQKTFKKTI